MFNPETNEIALFDDSFLEEGFFAIPDDALKAQIAEMIPAGSSRVTLREKSELLAELRECFERIHVLPAKSKRVPKRKS